MRLGINFGLGGLRHRLAASGDPLIDFVVLNAHFDAAPLTDSSPAAMTMNLVGTASVVSGGAFGSALRLPGTNTSNHATVAANSMMVLPGAFTIEFWINKTSGGNQCCALAHNGGSGYVVYCNSINVIRFVTPGGDTSLTDTPVPSGVWSHVAVCRDASNVWSGYVNGIKSTASRTWAGDYGVNGLLRVGADQFGPGKEFFMDDLRITRGVARYSSNFDVPTSPFTDS